MSINRFLSVIAQNGGMSFSNNYLVDIPNPPVGFDIEQLAFFCDEAQLPNINTATGTQTGLYTGLGSIDYPHTRVFTELQLGFMLDANLSILKSLNGWHNTIFSEYAVGDGDPWTENRVTRLSYMDDYVADILITKTESGPDSTDQRRPITYVLEKAYPYSIDAVPLQFGSSQITKVTANFKYQRHYTISRDITGIKDKALVQDIRVVRGGGTELGVGANDLSGTSSGIA